MARFENYSKISELIHHAQQVGQNLDIPSLCASFSCAVSDTLIPRVEQALRETGYKKLAAAGGVAANSRIRKDLLDMVERLDTLLYLPPLSLCGDNAAMIGMCAYYKIISNQINNDLEISAMPQYMLEDFSNN